MKKKIVHPKIKGPLIGDKYVFMGGKIDGKFRPGADAMIVSYDEKIHKATKHLLGKDEQDLEYIEYLERHPEATGSAVLAYRDKGDVWEIVFQRDRSWLDGYMTDRLRSHVALPVEDFKDEKALAWKKIDDDDAYIWRDGLPYAKPESIKKLQDFGVHPRTLKQSNSTGSPGRRPRRRADNTVDWLIGLGILGAGAAAVATTRRARTTG